MHRNRGYPPNCSALSFVKAVKKEQEVTQHFLKDFEAKKIKERELATRVDNLRARWAEFKGRIEKAFLKSSSDEKERLAAQVKDAEKDLEEKMEKNEHLTQSIECLLRIYCIIKKYNQDSENIRKRIEDLVEDINKYITKGQIVGYYSALANSFDLIHDSYIKYSNRTIQCKKELLIEDITEHDQMIFLSRLLSNDLQNSKKSLSSWERTVTTAKNLGSDDLYTSTHLKICIPHYVSIYSQLSSKDQPTNIKEQVERINYIFLHMKAIVHHLENTRIKNDEKSETDH